MFAGRHSLPVLVWFAAACGPDVTEPIDCSAAVTPLLALDPGDKLHGFRRIGDGIAVARSLDDADPNAPLEIVVSEGCGAEPRIVVDQLAAISVPPRDDLPWVVTFRPNARWSGSWLLDPTAEAPLVEPISERWAQVAAWIDGGVLVTHSHSGEAPLMVEAITRVPGGFDRVILRDDLAEPASSKGIASAVAFATTSDQAVVLDLSSGKSVVVDEGIDWVGALDADARSLFVGYLDAPIRYAVHDRSAGLKIPLGAPDRRGYGYRTTYDEICVTSLGERRGEPRSEGHCVFLPDMRELRFTEPTWVSSEVVDGGARLLSIGEQLHHWAPASETPRPLGIDDAHVVFASATDFYVRRRDPMDPRSTRLLRVPSDASAFVDVLERGLYDVAPAGNDRWFYVESNDGSAPLALRIYDQRSGVDRFVATDLVADVNTDGVWTALQYAVGARQSDAFARPLEDLVFLRDTGGSTGFWRADIKRILE